LLPSKPKKQSQSIPTTAVATIAAMAIVVMGMTVVTDMEMETEMVTDTSIALTNTIIRASQAALPRATCYRMANPGRFRIMAIRMIPTMCIIHISPVHIISRNRINYL
jgi:hypothetical protein